MPRVKTRKRYTPARLNKLQDRGSKIQAFTLGIALPRIPNDCICSWGYFTCTPWAPWHHKYRNLMCRSAHEL